jgi:hypothetical protein
MGRPFKGRSRGVEVTLDAGERQLLVQLLGQLDELLDDGRPASTDPLAALVGFDLAMPAGPDDGPPAGLPQDPALARLLPDAHRDDPELAAEFRRLTETGLRSRKRQNARVAADALGRDGGRGGPLLATEEAAALVTSLTDLRLVLAERLELRTDEDATDLHHELRRRMASGSTDGADPWAAAAALYDVLTWWQECLVAALTSRKQRRSHG